jgi:hypothetical protein
VLEGLALQHASGALEIDGFPSGTIYFDRGHITFAETTWSPDLGARLAGLLPATDELRDLLLSAGQPDADIGTALAERGLVTRDELRAMLESVVIDAVIALTVPLAEEASVTDIRLQTPRPHWAAGFCEVRVDAARAAALEWARRLAGGGVPRAARLELRDMDHSRAVLTRLQWMVARHVNGTLTTWDLAWQCGLALCDTVEAVDALARAGLCAPVPADRATARCRSAASRKPRCRRPRRRSGRPRCPPCRCPRPLAMTSTSRTMARGSRRRRWSRCAGSWTACAG